MRFKHVDLDPKRVKAGPEDGLNDGEFIVYPSTFTRTPDAYGDVVAKGAFEDTIKEWQESGNVLPGLYGHRMDDPDYFIAGAQEMGEDEHGWWVKGSFDLDSPKGPQVYRLVKDRKLTQLSFAYDVIDEAPVKLEDGTKANELRKLKVYEFSFVPIGANQDTSVVAVKAIAEGLKAGRVLSAKNEAALREARDAIDSVLSSLGEEDGSKSTRPGGSDQEQQASETPAAKSDSDEEPLQAKSSASDEEPPATSPVDAYLAVISIQERN